MAVSIVFISFFATAFGIWFYYLKTRNSERLALISSGADASLFYSKKKSRNYSIYIVIILGFVFFAIGLGIISGYALENYMMELSRDSDRKYYSFPQAYFTSIFIFTGLALIISFFVMRRLIRQDDELTQLEMQDKRD
jgi:ABC-type Fe3+ transport system permease subunit